MDAAKMIESESKGAEIHHGAICKEKLHEIMDEFSVPRCLFFKVDEQLEEFGFNRSTGFFWLKLKTKTERKIEKIGTSYYDILLTGFMEPRRISKITGVKAKDMLLSFTITEILVGVPSAEKVKFISTIGVYRVHPIAAFEVVDKINAKKK